MIVHDCKQNTDEWFTLRAGMPTASEFSKLVSGTHLLSESIGDYAKKLGIELYKGFQSKTFNGTYHTRRGHELEPQAATEYALINSVELEIVGFITDDEQRIGASPDRTSGKDGLVQIKCLSDEEHYDVLEYYASEGTIKSGYMPQLQGEMLVAERAWNDIYFYHPNLPSLTHRVTPDESYLSLLDIQITKCLKLRDEARDFLREFSGSLIEATKPAASKLSIEI